MAARQRPVTRCYQLHGERRGRLGLSIPASGAVQPPGGKVEPSGPSGAAYAFVFFLSHQKTHCDSSIFSSFGDHFRGLGSVVFFSLSMVPGR